MLSQTHCGVELIIGDDGSLDDGARVVRSTTPHMAATPLAGTEMLTLP
jgi:hypothetical protein